MISGTFIFNYQIKIAYYNQDLIWTNDYQTPLEIVHDSHIHLPPKF